MIQQQLEWNVTTIGYNARGAAQALDTLMQQDQRVLLIDTRLKPWSQRPEWRQETLATKYGGRYHWAGRYLGNLAYKTGGEHQIANWEVGRRGLCMYLSEGYRLILLCACPDYTSCHRQTIVQMLCASTQGVRVMEPELPAVPSGNTFMQREWTEQPGKSACISIQQPFATGIIEERKAIELRTWGTNYRGIIAIHAGAKWYGGAQVGKPVDLDQVAIMKESIIRLGLSSFRMGDYPTGAIIGIARLVQCRRFADEDEYEALRPAHMGSTEWDEREYGWHFIDVVKLEEPIKARGSLGLFGVDREPLEGVLREVGEA